MASITIRDVPEETHTELASRAALAGQSLQEYLRAQLIEIARRPDVRLLLDRVQQRKQASPARLTSSQILAHRDSGRQ